MKKPTLCDREFIHYLLENIILKGEIFMKKETFLTIIICAIATVAIVALLAVGYQLFQNKTTVASIDTQTSTKEEEEFEELDPGNTDLDLVILDDMSIEELLSSIINDSERIGENTSIYTDLANEDIVGNADEIIEIVKDDMIRIKRMEYYATAIKYSPLFTMEDEDGNLKYEEVASILNEVFDITKEYQDMGKLILDMMDAVKLYGSLPEEWQEAFDYLF